MSGVTQTPALTNENQHVYSKSIEDRTSSEHTEDGGDDVNQPAPITVKWSDLTEVTSSTYLGGIVSTTGGTYEDVKDSQNRKGKVHFHDPEISLEIYCTQRKERNSVF
ncbi:unnamed protein product [Trichobilharzia regenti]|nr:unnamed protein product [Trichobilharzia regenti]